MDMAMGAMGLGIVLTLRDQASNGLEKIRQKMTGLKDVSEQMTKRFDSGVTQMMSGLGMMAAGGKILGVVNGAIGSSVAVAASFEQAMARVKAVSGATGTAFDELSAQARQLGRDTQFSATQAANSQELLARAGFQTKEIIAALPGVLNMAAAEGMGLAEAADIASGTLRGFGMEAAGMGRVADVLAKGSAISNVSIATLGEALRNVAPDAKRLGLSLEETVAMLGALGDSAIKGGRAGTALSSMMSKIAAPTERGRKSLDALGVMTTKNGDLLNFNEILAQINAGVKARGLGTAQTAEHLKNIFGLTTQTEATVLMEALGVGKTGGLTEKLRNAGGAAGDMAKVMNDTLQGAMLRLESASEGLRIALGDVFRDAYRWGIDSLARLKSGLTGLIESFPLLTKLTVGLGGGLLTLAGGALILSGAVMAVSGAFKMWIFAKPLIIAGLASIKTQAVAATVALGAASGPLVLLIGLGAALYAAWKTNFGGIRDMITAISAGFDMAVSANERGVARVSTETAERLKKAGIWDFAVTMGRVFYRLRELWGGLRRGFMETVNRIRGGLGVMAASLGGILAPGRKFLEWLGVLGPMAKSSSEAWGKWGQAIGRWLPLIVAAVAAVKGAAVVAGICKSIAAAIGLINAAIAANPVGAFFLLTVGAITLLSAYWDDFGTAVGAVLTKIGDIAWGVVDTITGIFQAGVALITGDWQAFADAVTAIFTRVKDFVADIIDKISTMLSPVIDSLTWVGEKFGLIKSEKPVNVTAAMDPSNYSRRIYESLGYVFDEKGHVVSEPTFASNEERDARYNEAARRVRESTPGMEVLARQSQTRASAAGHATAQAVAGAPGRPLHVKNDVNMVVQPTTTDVFMDNEKVGEIVTRYEARQQMREGWAATQ